MWIDNVHQNIKLNEIIKFDKLNNVPQLCLPSTNDLQLAIKEYLRQYWAAVYDIIDQTVKAPRLVLSPQNNFDTDNGSDQVSWELCQPRRKYFYNSATTTWTLEHNNNNNNILCSEPVKNNISSSQKMHIW